MDRPGEQLSRSATGFAGVPEDVDPWAVFAAAPTPYLLLTPDFVIRGANRAYLRATHRTEEDLVGRHIFDAFPDNPDDPKADGVSNLRASLERAVSTGMPDVMGVQKYDIPVGDHPGEARFEERYWSPINTPVIDDAGRTVLLIHRVEDVTDFVCERKAHLRERDAAAALRDRVEVAEADLYARAKQLKASNERLRRAHQRERQVTLTLQRAMLPPPDGPADVPIAARYRPAADIAQVGGDWYDVIDLGDGKLSIAVGDIMGHGLTAARFMGQMRSASAAATYADSNPSRALEILDRFARTVAEDLIATAVHLMVDRKARTLTYSNAGHPPVVLLHDGEATFLETTSPPLASTPQSVPRTQRTVPLPEGATLIVYTDGLVERRHLDIDVGLRRLRDEVIRGAHLNVEALSDALLDALRAVDDSDDDVALVIARP